MQPSPLGLRISRSTMVRAFASTTALTVLAFLLGCTAACSRLAAATAPAQHWIASGGTSPALVPATEAEFEKQHLVPLTGNQTVRELVHLSVGGAAVRIRFSNAFGRGPLTISAASVALRGQGSAPHPLTSDWR